MGQLWDNKKDWEARIAREIESNENDRQGRGLDQARNRKSACEIWGGFGGEPNTDQDIHSIGPNKYPFKTTALILYFLSLSSPPLVIDLLSLLDCHHVI